MADCEYQIGGQGKFYSESEFKKLLSEGYLDKVMLENQVKIKGVKPNEELAKSFQLPSAVQAQAPIEAKDNYKVAQEVTAEVSKENPDASVLLTPKGEDLSLTAVYVGKENRGKGIGTNVLESVKKQADKLGKKIVLDTTAELDEETDLGRLENFYQNNGFTKVGENKFEYNPTAEIKTEETITPVAEVTPTEPVTKTEEKVTEPTAETITETEEKITEPATKKQRLQISTPLTENEKRVVKRGESVNQLYVIQDALEKSKTKKVSQYERALSSGKTTYAEVKEAIESAGIKVPDYIERFNPETKSKPTTKEQDNQKITVNPSQGYSFTYESEQEIPNELKGVSPINRSESTVGRGKKAKTNIRLTFSGQQLIDAGLGQQESQPAPETKQPTREAVVAKNLADFLRKGKLEKGTAMSSLPGFEQLWEGTIETVAKAIEVGGVTVGNFRKSINDGIKALKNTDKYKAITDNKQRAELVSQYRDKLNKLIPSFYNINPSEDFGNVWDSSTKIVKDSVSKSDKSPEALQKAIDEGFKNVKESAWYNALDKEQRQQFASDYNEAMNRMFPIEEGKEKVSKETVSKEERAKAKEFKEKVSEATRTAKPEKNIRLSESELLRMQIKYGNIAGKKTIENLQGIKEQIRDYAEENLPKDKYSKKEVDSLMRSISGAKTQKGLENALDKIDALVSRKLEKKAAQDRKALIAEVKSKIANNSKKVITKSRKGKISISSQKDLNKVIRDLKDQGLFDNIDSLTDSELEALNNNLDKIIETGRAEQKQLNALDEVKKKSDKALILQALSKQADDELNGKEQIEERFKKSNGHVIVNGQLMSGSDFENFISKEGNKDIDLTNVPFYYKRNTSKIKEEMGRETSIVKALKDVTLFNIVDLETHVKKLGAKSPELKQWIETNIMKPIREGKRREVEATWRITRQYQKDTKEIFGTDSLGRSKMYDALVAPTGITPKNSKISLSAGEVVTLYSILYNTNPNINDKYKIDSSKSANDMKTLMRENYLSPQEIYDFMHNPENKALLDYAHYLSEKFNVDARALFGPTIEQLHNITLGEEYYFPNLRSASDLEAENIMDSEKNRSLSVTATSMRHREPNSTTPFRIIDAHQLYLNYINSMTHAKEFIPVVKASYNLLSDVNKPYVLEKLGSVYDYNDFVKSLGNAVADKLAFESGPMTAFTNYTSLSLLWFRIKAVSQQMTSMFHFYTAGFKDGVSPLDIATAVPMNKRELDFVVKDFLLDNPYLYTRLSGGNITPEMNKLKEQIDSISNRLLKGTISYVQFAGLFPIKGGDSVAAASPGGGMNFALAQFKKKYEETGDYDTSREHAIQRWMEETERVGQIAMARELMSTQSFNNLVRLFIPFSSAQQGMGKKAYKAYLDLKDFDNLTNREKTQAVADLIYYPFVAPIPFLLAGNLGYAMFQMIFDDEEDEVSDAERKRVYYDLVMDSAQSQATALGVPGLIFNITMNIARDRAKFNQAPSYQRLTDIGSELVSLLKANRTWEDLSVNERKAFVKEYTDKNGPLKDKTFKDIYDETIVSEKQIDTALKSLGLKNIKELFEDISSFSKDGDFWKLLTGIETENNELNKKLIPYFNDAVKYGKKDELYAFLERLKRSLSDENYIPEEYVPKEGQKLKKSKSRPSSPRDFKPRINKPRIPKF